MGKAKRGAFFISAWGVTILLALANVPRAEAWYDHTVVMDRILPRLENEVTLPSALKWDAPVEPDPYGVSGRFVEIAGILLLQTESELKSAEASTPREYFRLAPEDPDHGLDRNLPDSADPSNDRRFMGGATGSSSQGFRHMFWPGWDWRKPISTFQIPSRALGQAPDRIDLLANEARNRIRNGDYDWGLRILGWALHYIQDLTQPFHSVQIPALSMVPWSAALRWPPTSAFDHLVAEGTRTITNYHWAYEGYVRHALVATDSAGKDLSPFGECFRESGGSILVANPRELALELIHRSIGRASQTGNELMDFIGPGLMAPGVKVPIDPAQVDVAELLSNSKRAAPREKLNRTTCESLRLATDASVWLVKWAFAK